MQIERVAVQRQGQRLDALHTLASHAQRLLARHQHLMRWRGVQQLRSHRRNGVERCSALSSTSSRPASARSNAAKGGRPATEC